MSMGISNLNINNYLLKEPLSDKDAAYSVWGIASRGGKQYFLKSFLSPKYPLDENGNELTAKKSRINRCREFESSKAKLYEAIHKANTEDGNLVEIHQFFRSGPIYYISTEAIQEKSLSVEDIQKLTSNQKLQICCSLAHSFAALSNYGIVHADVKPTNIMITGNKSFRARVIDFDAGFLETDAPEPGEELTGDQTYIAPEALAFINGEEEAITCKIDVFALGILFHEYMTGKRPEFDIRHYDTFQEAVGEGAKISLGTGNKEFDKLLKKMLDKNPENRPSAAEVFKTLHHLLVGSSDGKTTTSANTKENYTGGLMHTAGDL